jgi:hypothetical protein
MLMIFHHPKAKTFCLASFLAKKKQDACDVARVFFYCNKVRHATSFCSRMMKNPQHPHKGKPHTQGIFQQCCNFCGGCNDKN